VTGRALRFHEVPRFTLESGETLTSVRQAYHLDGTLSARRDNLAVVFHSLTGGPDCLDWWSGVVGPGRAIDTERWAVLCPNLLGSCYGTTFSRGSSPTADLVVTTRDMVRLAALLALDLGVSSVALATGGSLGGMAALEWAATFPDLTRAAVVFAAPAAHTAYAIGWNHIQRTAIRLAGREGLALARMVGMMTYRTAAELEERFGRRPGAGERFAAQDYLTHHGVKLVERFDAASYLTLIGAMDAHDTGRGRGGIRAALRAFRGRLVGVGISGDLLYPEQEVKRWVDEADGEYRELVAAHGHDSFLLEPGAVGEILREALDSREPSRVAPLRAAGG
jgi:homoserine O-acetyltransferase/O-succinyltransferase